MDRNEIILVGRIGAKIKSGTTVNGDAYIWMPIYIENNRNANTTDNNRYQNINVMCYKPNVIKYLDKVHAHRGSKVIVFGFVSSFSKEIKGKEIIANAINANEILVIKTKAEKSEEEKED